MANTKIPAELSSTPSISDSGDATAITIDSSENVGIGVSPVAGQSGSRTLHINSSNAATYLRLTNSSTGTTASDGFDILNVGSNAYVWNREDGDLKFGVDNTEKMRLTDDGELQLGTSIGNSTYAGQFNSVANLGSSGANIQTRNGDGNKHLILRGDNNVEYGSLGLTSPTGTGLLQIQGESGIAIRGASAADHIRIDSNGKVGIGTTSPAKTLDVRTSGGSDAVIRVGSSGHIGINVNVGEIEFYSADPDDAGVKASIANLVTGNQGPGGAVDGNLIFSTTDSDGGGNDSPTERMRIHSNGGISLTGNHQFNFRANGASNPGNGATIVFDAVKDGNAAGCYNTSNGFYEAQIAGWYMFSIGIRYDSISGSGYTRPQFAYLAHQSSGWVYPHQGGWVDPIEDTSYGTGTYNYFPYTVPIYLGVGDTVRVVNNGNTSNSVNHDESHFGCIFMG